MLAYEGSDALPPSFSVKRFLPPILWLPIWVACGSVSVGLAGCDSATPPADPPSTASQTTVTPSPAPPVETSRPTPSPASPTPSPAAVVEPPPAATKAEVPATPSADADPIFEEVLPQVQSQTEVPILLPSQVPLPDDLPIFATAQVEPQGYVIELAFSPDCRGASACFYGMFAAKRTQGTYYGIEGEFEQTVTLTGGIVGDYAPMRCGASCSPPVLEWSLDGVRYRMALKGLSGDDATAQAKMVELANSAIASQP